MGLTPAVPQGIVVRLEMNPGADLNREPLYDPLSSAAAHAPAQIGIGKEP